MTIETVLHHLLLGLVANAILFWIDPIESFDHSTTVARRSSQWQPNNLFVPPTQYGRGTCSWLSATPQNNDYSFRLPLESPFEDEQRPRRLLSVDETRYDYSVNPDDWGVEYAAASDEPQFPNSIDALTDAAFEAIAGTLYSKQRLDPNVASNAMTRSIFGYRPVRSSADVGRIGIEIDGAHHLLPHLSEGSAIRRVALVLAAKLSRGYWEGFEEQEINAQKARPVAIYFNTIKQSLLASQELQLLKRADIMRDGDKPRGKFKNVTILCLGQEDEIPANMRQAKTSARRRSADVGRGKTEPQRGVLLVVQPTDFNDEFEPPGPSVGSVCSLQTLIARATIQGLPTVVVSPRFLASHDLAVAGWDQSGYQQSAIFGGAEPPRGPTPWVMRDFNPPAFCWVANALPLSPKILRVEISSRQPFSRIALMQSVMHPAHPWHMFATRDTEDYKYIASTKTSSGRPTRDLMKAIFSEWYG